MPRERVLIVGAGLAGSLLAVSLARAGYDVEIHERRPDPRKHGFAGGRSINLALSMRGITALERVGLANRILADAVRMPGRMIHDRAGRTAFQHYSKNADDAINSVSRSGLNLALIEEAARLPEVSLHFDSRCIDVDLEAPAAVFEQARASERVTRRADFVLAADGAFSAVRDAMLKRVPNFNYAQEFLEHGYKELHIPFLPGSAQSPFAMPSNALHIWPRGGSMMIALPNRDGSFTCTLFWPYEGEHGFSAIRGRGDIRPFFERHYSDAVPLMPTLEDDYERNPVGSLVTIRCDPWHWKDKVLILGDAAHAIVPFFGQGMNAAFEDVRILDNLLRANPADRARAFALFGEARKANADAIADMALENFVEMRDRTASRAFRARKKVEHSLHAMFPHWFMPLYNMVSFSNIPYAEARRRAKRQWRVVWTVMGALAFVALVVVLLFVVL